MSRYRSAAMSAALAAQRAQARAVRETERELRRHRKEVAIARDAAGVDIARSRSVELEERMEELTALVASSASVDYRVSWEKMRAVPSIPAFKPGGLLEETPQPDEADFSPPAPNWLQRTIAPLKARYNLEYENAVSRFADAKNERERAEHARLAALEAYRKAYDQRALDAEAEASSKNKALDDLRSGYQSGDVESVQSILEIILANDQLPDIDSSYDSGYEKSSRRAVVERQLPTVHVVPEIESIRYVKSSNEFVEKRRALSAIKSTYNTVCAAIVVRTMRAIAVGDEARQVDTIVVNAYVDTIDPATGRRIRPTLISVSASADDIRSLEVAVLDPVACLKRLRARVSANSHELIPVTPIMDFNMLDARFVAETDILGTLDTRPNLADLTPTEFESLMTNLFEKMGLETRQTRASRDGGVDCVAWDMRPVIGGKVVIQAKRYKNTVGVSAVRDLYGTMMNEHAAKGLLVTTSGYGRATYEFAKEKPLELISGENLLALLKEHTGVEAKIIFPDEWIDLAPDP